MPLTGVQIDAVRARGNVCVVAGAGTGKTGTLVERCLDCLQDPHFRASLDELLIVTFTEAAATEMRQRLRTRLEELVQEHPADFHWHEQLALFDAAHIGTLHSFCFQLIRPHFYELEIDPQVSVMAEEEAHLLAQETLDALLERHYGGRTADAQAVQRLIQGAGSGSDQAIRKLVLRLHHYVQTLPNPSKWIEEETAKFRAPTPILWQQWLMESFERWRAEWLELLEHGDRPPIFSECATLLRAMQPPLARLALAEGLARIKTLAESCGAPGKKNGRGKGFANFRRETEFLWSLVKMDEIDPLEQDWQWVREEMVTLLQLAREFDQNYGENKRELAMLDFHDLEQCALRLLWNPESGQPTAAARHWQQKLKYIFVDEYQDINAAQDRILQALSRENPAANRFLVGDFKQSIYRFRQANPRIFQSYAVSWRGQAGQSIALRDNFRSREGLLDCVNSLFSRIMIPEIGGVIYNEEARLQFGAREEREPLARHPEDEACVELHLRLKQHVSREEEEEEVLADNLQLQEQDKEARIVALRLKELKEQRRAVWDEKNRKFRPVEWSDMAVLLRSPAYKAESYAKEFARLNIPLLVARVGFYETIEVTDLVSLLTILDNPLQDVPMLAVLHSPFGGLTINELARIRLAAKGPFWNALLQWEKNQKVPDRDEPTPAVPPIARDPAGAAACESAGQARGSAQPVSSFLESAETLRKVKTFIQRFSRWRWLARQSSISRCLETVLTESQYRTWLLTQSRAQQRRANVQHFLRLAQRFDSFRRQGLFRFLCFIQAQQESDTEPQVEPPGAADSVRLMSIHQSKGLEFPLVVVADLGKSFNQMDLHAEIILDEHYGLCPRITPPHTGKSYPSLPYWLAQKHQKRELLGEELRLLYVAMTRARDLLLLSAGASEKTLKKITRPKAESRLEGLSAARTAWDWIELWLAEHSLEGKPLVEHFAAASFWNKKFPGAGLTVTGPGQSKLQFFVHEEARLNELSSQTIQTSASTPTPAATKQALAEIRERLAWTYPFLPATRTPAKASVTALRRRAALELDAESSRVAFGGEPPDPGLRFKLGNSPVTQEISAGAEAGRAHHAFLQLMSLNSGMSAGELQAEAERLVKNRALTAGEVALLDFPGLAAFWNSELGQRIRAHSARVRRELPFTARFSPEVLATIIPDSASPELAGEFIVVQGVADLVVELPEQLWLVDFKTDVLEPAELASRVSFYQPQMRLYARALQGILQRPVTECWLYFLRLQTPVALTSAPAGSMANLVRG